MEDIPRHLLCIHNSLHLSMSLNATSGDRKWPWTPHPVSVGALLSCLWTNTFLYTFRIDAYSRVVCLCVCVNYGGAHTREVDRRVNWIVGKMQIRACLFERGRRGLSDWRLSLWRLHTQTQQDHFDHILQREWRIVFVYAFFSHSLPFSHHYVKPLSSQCHYTHALRSDVFLSSALVIVFMSHSKQMIEAFKNSKKRKCVFESGCSKQIQSFVFMYLHYTSKDLRSNLHSNKLSILFCTLYVLPNHQMLFLKLTGFPPQSYYKH